MKHLCTLLVLALLLATGLVAQDGTGAPAHGQQEHGEHAADAVPVRDMPDKEFFLANFRHLIPHPADGGHHEEALTFYNSNLFQAIAVVLILVIFTLVKNSFGPGPTGGVVRVFRGWCHWLRDELVYNVMGPEEGRRFAPFFMYLFFFVAFMNLLGLVPLYGVTATASYFVTGTMAVITFGCMLGFGVAKQGPVKYLVNLLPHGLPIALIPLMVVVELMGLFIKPFALAVRLFANMLAGHMVIYGFLGLIFVFAKLFGMNTALSTLTAVPAVAMSVFINIIESFIALLQAYIFTYLSVIFIHQAMHPAH